MPPPTQTYAPPPKTTMFFSVCVGEIDVKKWGGGQSGGGRKSGGGKWGGHRECPPHFWVPPPLKNTMDLRLRFQTDGFECTKKIYDSMGYNMSLIDLELPITLYQEQTVGDIIFYSNIFGPAFTGRATLAAATGWNRWSFSIFFFKVYFIYVFFLKKWFNFLSKNSIFKSIVVGCINWFYYSSCLLILFFLCAQEELNTFQNWC